MTLEGGSVKKMEDLVLGDSVLATTEDDEPLFSPFLGWLHREDAAVAKYLHIETDNNNTGIISSTNF